MLRTDSGSTQDGVPAPGGACPTRWPCDSDAGHELGDQRVGFGAAPAEKAGAASAVNSTASDLGVALLGSVGTAFYRAGMAGAVPSEATGEQAAEAAATLPGAVEAADALSSDAGGSLVAAAQAAFTDGLKAAAWGAAALSLTSAVLAAVVLRGRRGAGTTPQGMLSPKNRGVGTGQDTCTHDSPPGRGSEDLSWHPTPHGKRPMTTVVPLPSPSDPPKSPSDPPKERSPAQPLRRWHRPLVYFAALSGLLAVATCVGMVVDDRTLLGEPLWLKPFKFAVSFGLYCLTLAWMFSLFPRWRRTLWVLGTAVAAACLAEMAVFLLQAWRGTRSHFNVATEFDAQLQQVMGNGSIVLLLGTLAIGILLVVQKRVDRPLSWAIRLGVLLCVAGMAVGPLMTRPTPDQVRAEEAGVELETVGAHSVGAPDGGEAIPVTSWNAKSGDLRVPHFVGLHGMQAVPLLALGLAAASRRVPALRQEGLRTALVVVAAAGYAGLVALLMHQALRGQPLLRPDALTLAEAGGLAAAVALAGAAVYAVALRRARTDRPPA
ncbi:hypothetical protein ACFWTE_25245 [Nocardiopsis sp. NPDC058631]|uniref:hypothetical protein n=1 Tax=Nocardiopsis sp. NPDC058631 TaxID=3346566 RepID=UPI00365F66AE